MGLFDEPTKGEAVKVAVREKCGTLYLEYTPPGGKKKWENLHLHLKGDAENDREARAMAEQAANIRERQLVAGQWGLQNPEDSRLTVEAYAEKLARKYPKSYHLPKALKHIRGYSKGMYIAAATDQWVAGFGEYLLKLKKTSKAGAASKLLSDTSAAHYFSALRHVFNVAYRDNVIVKNPAQYVEGIQIPEPDKVWLSTDEMVQLRKTYPRAGEFSKEIKRGFLFDCNVGLRISDLKALTWGNIKLVDGQRRIVIRQQKTRKMVENPLNESAWELIKDDRIHAKDELVFPLLSKSETQFAEYFREWEKHAGLDKRIGWHTARHTFAVQLLIAGADIYTVSRMLGHKSIKTTEIYLHAVDTMKRAAAEKLPDIRERDLKIVS